MKLIITCGKVSYRNLAFISPLKCGGFPPAFLKIFPSNKRPPVKYEF